MVKYVTGYVIMGTDNMGHRMSHGRFFKKSEAIRELRNIRSMKYRDTYNGVGMNNPRIKKTRLVK